MATGAIAQTVQRFMPGFGNADVASDMHTVQSPRAGEPVDIRPPDVEPVGYLLDGEQPDPGIRYHREPPSRPGWAGAV